MINGPLSGFLSFSTTAWREMHKHILVSTQRLLLWLQGASKLDLLRATALTVSINKCGVSAV